MCRPRGKSLTINITPRARRVNRAQNNKMDTEEIKVGEEYVLPVVVKEIDEEGWVRVKIGKANNLYTYCPKIAAEFCRVTKPKYDPCRKLRRMDKVRVVERNGRIPICFPVGRIQVGDIVTVAENESGDVFIKVLTEDGHEMMAPWFMLELVTPVEELEPYSVSEATVQFLVKKDGKQVVSQFCKLYHPNAKAAAEAERDRLNAEYREEMGK